MLRREATFVGRDDGKMHAAAGNKSSDDTLGILYEADRHSRGAIAHSSFVSLGGPNTLGLTFSAANEATLILPSAPSLVHLASLAIRRGHKSCASGSREGREICEQ